MVLTLFASFREKNDTIDWHMEFSNWKPTSEALLYMEHCADYYIARELQNKMVDEEYEAYRTKMNMENNLDEPDHEFYNEDEIGINFNFNSFHRQRE
jgi:hypothetical protein